jgi:hypothetical protein
MITTIIAKILGPKAAPTRAAIEKAMGQAKAERERAEAAVTELTVKRRAILLRASDAEAAEHDTRIASEQRAADRAMALIEELQDKLTEVIEREQTEAVAAERQQIESLIASAISALDRYPALASEIAQIIQTVEAAEKAALAFNGKHEDEPIIVGPEARIRSIAPTPMKVLKREPVDLWVGEGNGNVVDPDSDMNARIRQVSGGRGILVPNSGQAHYYVRRPYERVTFIPETQGAKAISLADSIVMPGLKPTDKPFADPKRHHPAMPSVAPVETDYRLIPTPAVEPQPAIDRSDAEEAA